MALPTTQRAPKRRVNGFYDASAVLKPGSASQHRVLDSIILGEAAIALPARQDLYLDEPLDLRGGRRLVGAQGQATRIRMRDTTQPIIISGRKLLMSGGTITQVGGEHNEVGHLRIGYEAQHANAVPALALAGPMSSWYHDIYIYRAGIGIGFLAEAGHNGGAANQGVGAVVAVTLADGGAAAATVVSGGSGYGVIAPTLTVTGDGYGMRLRAVLTAGVLTSVLIDDPGVGYTAATVDVIPGNWCQFSNNFDRMNIRNCGVSYIDLRSTTGQTGSHFNNLYCNGWNDAGTKNTIDTGILLGTGDEDVFNQINIEHTKIRTNVIYMGSDCGPKTINSLHMEGIDLVTDSGKTPRAYIRVSNSGAQPRLTVNGWSLVYSQLTAANVGASASSAGIAMVEVGSKAGVKVTGFVERSNTVDIAKWLPAAPVWSGSMPLADGDAAVEFENSSVTAVAGGTYTTVMKLDRASQATSSDGRTPVLRRFNRKRYGPDADHLGYVAGRYYPPRVGYVAPTTAAVAAADTIYAVLLRVEEEVSIDALGLRVVTGTTGAAIKVALYAVNPAAPYKPDGGALLGESPAVAATVNNTSVPFILGAPGAPGTPTPVSVKRFVWAAIKATASTTLPSVVVLNEQVSRELGSATIEGAISFTANALKGYSAADAFANNFPAVFPTASEVVTSIAPLPSWRCAVTT